jgi:predicted RNA methylase
MATLGFEASLLVIFVPPFGETARLSDRSFVDLLSIVKQIIDFIDNIDRVWVEAAHQASQRGDR